MNWDRWLDEVLEKADQLSLFGGPKLTVAARRPAERTIAKRPDSDKPGGAGAGTPTAAPTRRLKVPPPGGKAPPGGGWRKTPSGWARGQGDTYEWQPAGGMAKPTIKGPLPGDALSTAKESVMWSVRDAGKSIGYILLENHGKGWIVGQVHVDPDHRRTGIATNLYREAKSWAESRGGLRQGMVTGEGPKEIWAKLVTRPK